MRAWDLNGFERSLRSNEKSENTISKYLRDVKCFMEFSEYEEISMENLIRWKQSLLSAGYKPRSINSMIAAVNSYLTYTGHQDCILKSIRIQKYSYRQVSEELTRDEYFRLVGASAERPKLQLIMQTICSTGIRVSELGSFTVEAVRAGEVVISCKGKFRIIIIPALLRKLLLDYSEHNHIETGVIFLSKSGKPIDRVAIWQGMKSICNRAGVDPGKVYPHNLRKLFAREFYAADRDISKLADVLGHSSIETTRIYIMGTGEEHRALIDKLGLVLQ